MFDLLIVLITAFTNSVRESDPVVPAAIPAVSFGGFEAPVPQIDAVPATSTVATFVGDIMMARDVETLMKDFGAAYPFQEVLPLLTGDYIIGNFEAAIPEVHRHTPDLTFSFSVSKEYIERLGDAGFSHLSLANNHAYDFGQTAHTNTVTILNEHDLTVFGEPGVAATSSMTFLKDYRGSTTALLALDFVDDAPSDEEIASLLESAASLSDRQVLYVHWGPEYVLTHSDEQKRLAQVFVSNGVDLIIGHHPHVVQDVVLVDGVLVFYSLGNFVFDQYFSDEVQTGLVVSETVTGNEYQYELVPVTSIGSRAMPRRMAPFERQRFLDALADRSDAVLADDITNGVIRVPIE